MNQDQIKAKLYEIMQPERDVTVTFSGKKSKKVNGLYKPDEQVIIIHNKNFEFDGKVNENMMMYTAIHEYAHHIRAIKDGFLVTRRPHDNEFKTIFENLLNIAREKNIYQDDIFSNEEFAALTKNIRDNYLTKDAKLMKEFGGLLVDAMRLCDKYHARFEDYVERELKIGKNEAQTLMRIHSMDINPDIGLDNMKMVSRISNQNKREEAANKILDGEGIQSVKSEYLTKPKPDNAVERLFAEKEEIQRRIASLQNKLRIIEEQIDTIDKQG